MSVQSKAQKTSYLIKIFARLSPEGRLGMPITTNLQAMTVPGTNLMGGELASVVFGVWRGVF